MESYAHPEYDPTTHSIDCSPGQGSLRGNYRVLRECNLEHALIIDADCRTQAVFFWIKKANQFSGVGACKLGVVTGALAFCLFVEECSKKPCYSHEGYQP